MQIDDPYYHTAKLAAEVAQEFKEENAKLTAIVKELREALEFYAYFPYKEGLVHVKAEDVPPPINWEKIQPSDIIPIAKYSYDKGDVAKQALLRVNL